MESITNNMAIVPAGHHNYREVALPLGAHLPNFGNYLLNSLGAMK
jgi:hypothetical protein